MVGGSLREVLVEHSIESVGNTYDRPFNGDRPNIYIDLAGQTTCNYEELP